MRKILIDVNKDNRLVLEDILVYVVENKEMFNKRSFKISLNKKIVIEVFEKEEFFLEFLSNILTEYIISAVEPQIIREEVEAICDDFFYDDIENVYESTIWQLLHKDKQELIDYSQQINDGVYQFLYLNNNFNLTAFLRFKYKDRKNEIKNYVHSILDDLLEEEDEDYVEEIKKLVSEQPKRIDSVDVIVLGENDYEIITSENERIDLRDVDSIINEELAEAADIVNQMHLIMGTLLTIGPEKVVVHSDEDQDPAVAQMLYKIYKDNYRICTSCKLCKKIRKTRDKK